MNIFKNLKFNRLSFKNLQVVLNIQQLGLEFLSLNQCGCKGYTASSWLSASTDDCCPAFPAVVSKCEESTNPWASSLRKARNCPQLQSFQRQRNFSHLGKGGGRGLWRQHSFSHFGKLCYLQKPPFQYPN